MDKPMLGILIGKAKGDKMPEADADEKESPDSVIAAKAILAAMKSGDATKLDEALRSHYTLCSDD